MKCEAPVATQGMLVGCGQCIPCRTNRARVWSHRIELEASLYEDNTFLTLTYDDKHLPKSGSLEPKALQDFVKRLRRYHEPLSLRYFACGEYGDLSERPHYHAIVFNFPTCERLETTYNKEGKITCCRQCRNVEKIWLRGRVQLARVSEQSVRYVCGYVVKKMTHRLDPRLHGREPEFSRMSLNKGIGYQAMEVLNADILRPTRQLRGPTEDSTISSLSYGRSKRPLGRYLTRRLNVLRGLPANAHAQEAYDAAAAELLDLRLAARSSEDNPSFVEHYKTEMEGKFASQRSTLKRKKERPI